MCLGIFIIHFTQPTLHRPFKTPWWPWIPLLGALSCFTLMVLIPGVIWLQLLVFMILGCAVYFLYSRKHSKVQGKG